MAYRTRSARRTARKSKYNIFAVIIISFLLLYATITWILPIFVNSLGFATGVFKKEQKVTQVSDNSTLAPPVLNIPFEATNSAQIDIKGYATPGSKVKIYVDDELKDTVGVQPDGSFVAKSIELNLGTNNIYGKTIDEKDQESLASKTIKLVYDSEKPPLEISEPEDGKVVQGERRLKVSGKTKPGAQVTVNGTQLIVNSDGNFSSTYNLNDGGNSLTIKASDRASNFTEVTRKVTFNP